MAIFYPVSTLHLCKNKPIAVAVSGPHFQIFDIDAGSLRASSTALQPPTLDGVLKSGPIRCSQVDPSESFLVTSGDDKVLKVWQLSDLQLVSARELPKKPTCIIFTTDGQSILVADKFGDVFRYPLHASTAVVPEPPKEALSSHDNPSGGELVLGHVSLLTSILLSPDERYIISADRDEHIRTSWYPQAYTIESFCLGHTKFISSIHIPKFATSKLVSGGGDPCLKIWDWMSGKQLCEVPVWDAVEPFIVVLPQKRRRQEEDDDNEANTTAKKKGKRSGKGKEKKSEEDVEMVEETTPAETEPIESTPSETLQAKKTLVIEKVDSVEINSMECLVFSAVGATALFACTFPTVTDQPLSISHIDLGCPVINFNTLTNNQFLIMVDSGWNGASDTRHIRVVQISTENDQLQFVELGNDTYPALAKGLNSTENHLAAEASDLVALDLYHAVSAMPKHAEAEHDAMDREGELERKGKSASKKELARLKRKGELASLATTDTSVEVDADNVDKSKRQKS